MNRIKILRINPDQIASAIAHQMNGVILLWH
jgi:hypothetical protein